MIEAIKRINRIHSAWTPESKWQSGNLILLSPRWSVAEGDVSYKNFMRVKSFSYPSTGWSYLPKRTCASQRRQARYAELSRVMLPWCSIEHMGTLDCSWAFCILARVPSLSVLRATPMDSPDAATCCAVRSYHGLNTPGAAGDKEGTLCCSFVR